jgi:hypothetical protein
MKAAIRTLGNRTFLDFFNTSRVYSIKGFDTVRKAKNYAARNGYTLYEALPAGVSEFENDN